MSEILTTEEVAEYLRTSVENIKRMARRGDLPASKLGRNWRFRRRDLDDWFETGGTAYEKQVDEGLRLAIEESKANVVAGRSKLIPWEEAEAELDR
jgi:excisionase family DNA binding protein